MRLFVLLAGTVSLLNGQGLGVLSYDTDTGHILLLTHGAPDGLAHAYNTGVFWENPGNLTDTSALVTMVGSLRHVLAPGTHGEPPNITKFNYKRTLAGAGTGLFGSIQAYGTYHPPTGHWDVFYGSLYGGVTGGAITGFVGGVVGAHLVPMLPPPLDGPVIRGGKTTRQPPSPPPPGPIGPCGAGPGDGGGFGFGGAFVDAGSGTGEFTAGDCDNIDPADTVTEWKVEGPGGVTLIDLLPTMEVQRALNRILRRARAPMAQAALDSILQGTATMRTVIGPNVFVTPLEIIPSEMETFSPLSQIRGGWRQNQGAGTLVTTVTLRNNTPGVIQGPSAFAVRVPSPAQVANRTGNLVCGSAILGPPGTPYIIVPGDFPPGASRTIPIEMVGLSLTSVNQVHLTQAVSVPLDAGSNGCR
jgi:hypothetical protein